MLHAETLFLVDHDQAEILEAHFLAEQPMCSDHDVDAAVGESGDDRLRFGVGLEARQSSHLDRELCVPLGEGVHVLLDEQRGRHQHRDLLAVLHGLEHRTYGNLGLAIADVTADHPIHWHRLLHVALDLVDDLQLVGCLRVRERVFEFALPHGVRRERKSLRTLTRGV